MRPTPPAPPPPAPVAIAAAAAEEAGLTLRATLPAAPLDEEVNERLAAWFAAERAGEMEYLERGRPSFGDLRTWKPWTRGALLFAMPYARAAGGFRGGGRVARYALGRDYHHVLGRRLEKLGRALRARGFLSRFRAVVDAAPVLEREWAVRGAVGFRGKNTLLLHPRHGPWVLLGELLVDVEMPPWAPPSERAGHCGSCTRCLDACPTQAFDGPFLLDPRRCISYLTIESRSAIPPPLRRTMGNWVFGCDVCLEVCPFGSHAEDQAAVWGLHPALTQLTLEDLPTLSPEVFHRLFTGSPIRRAGPEGLARNAVVVLGNLGRGGSALRTALADHPSALVRGHAAWALGRLGGERAALEAARHDPDPSVRCESEAALTGG
jgi:epoxyqueuosine reductase